MPGDRVALITGANKGIGFETARELARRGLTVLLGIRDEERGAHAVGTLRAEGLDAHAVALDVTNEASAIEAARRIWRDFGRLDVLVNDAGISSSFTKPSETKLDEVRRVFETNVLGVIAVTNAMLPMLRRAKPPARIVNVSSGVGSLALHSDPNWEYAARLTMIPYPASKSALNMVTVQYAKELAGTGIKVNAADPGYTATDFNSNRGTQTVQEGAAASVTLALLDESGPTGGFFDAHGRVPVRLVRWSTAPPPSASINALPAGPGMRPCGRAACIGMRTWAGTPSTRIRTSSFWREDLEGEEIVAQPSGRRTRASRPDPLGAVSGDAAEAAASESAAIGGQAAYRQGALRHDARSCHRICGRDDRHEGHLNRRLAVHALLG
jgi:NAD(P)-dependent dehydrogenase (short-subunit alcohol dehydrogenase family)